MPRPRSATSASRRQEILDRLLIPVASAVLFMWIVSGLFALWTGEVKVFMATTGLMGGVVGAVLGIGLTRMNGTRAREEITK